MTDYLVSLDLNYWLIAFCVSLAINVGLLAHIFGLKAKLAHVFEHGHAPDGKVIVPAASVAAPPDLLAKTPATPIRRLV